MKKSCFLAPVHPPKFHFAEKFIQSYNQHFEDNDIFLMFTNEDEEKQFKEKYPNLKYQSFLYEPGKIISGSPASEKKFWGAKYLFNNFSYDRIALIDVDSLFFRNVDYDQLFQNYLLNRKIYGHIVIRSDVILGINQKCLRFFKEEHRHLIQKLMQDFNVFFWFNEIPIVERNSFREFDEYINLDKIIPELTNYDFEYILYAYFLMIKGYMNLIISDYRVNSDNGGILEIQKKISPDDFRLEYIKMNPMWIYKKIADYDMKNTFMMVHVDR